MDTLDERVNNHIARIKKEVRDKTSQGDFFNPYRKYHDGTDVLLKATYDLYEEELYLIRQFHPLVPPLTK